jgi:hypothetical protein
VEFQERGKTIKLQGVAANFVALSEISATNLLKSYKGNDVWALVVLNLVSSMPSDVPPELQVLLQELRMCLLGQNHCHLRGYMIILSHCYPVLYQLIPGLISIHPSTKMRLKTGSGTVGGRFDLS